ncbi:MAG: oligoendopeptidase F [Gammaproteobacteria bacterium]|jgi:oligoendopeptidase F|nr:oligoendopeptidase F [Gammaproteobacteria bacterium]
MIARHRNSLAAIAAGIFLLMQAGLAAETATKTHDIQDTWNLDELYPTVAAWEAARPGLEQQMDQVGACKGKLGESAAVLERCLDDYTSLLKEFYRFYVYASMGSDQDVSNQDAMGRRQIVSQLGTRFSQATSFASPELLEVGEDKLRQYMSENPGLGEYQMFLEDTLRQAPHTLSEESENVIAAAGNISRAPGSIYNTFANAEIEWPTITLSDGTEARLDQSGYTKYRATGNRDDRQKVFDAFWGTWSKYERTLGATLDASVSVHSFRANVRKYDGALQLAVSGDNIPEQVYRTLVSETNANLATLHRYFRLRARMLGIEKLRYFDIYPPLVALDKEFPLEVGKQLTLAAVAPLGEEYTSVMEKGFNERWMDVYPRKGKRSGAYMNGAAYDVHPYLLLNYNDDYESVSTLAHEWGHAMHTYLSAQNQSFTNYNYATFTAEIASTFNEALLLDHMLRVARDDDELLYYLGSALENIRGTFFRQTMFAEFELAIHEAQGRGEPLTGQKLTEIYKDLLRRYHGHDQGVMEIDDLYAIEWAYIPHFYNSFYVYQYATSIAASSLLAEKVLAGEEGALDRYMTLLKAGGSDYPYELLKRAGVDMATPDPYRATFDRMNMIMDKIEAILDTREAASSTAAR